MGTHNAQDSAFPIIQEDMNVSGGPGLSKLEYAAIDSLKAEIAMTGNDIQVDYSRVAIASIKAAKALLAELEKESE